MNAIDSDVLSGIGVKINVFRHVQKRSENRVKVMQ